MRHAWLTLRRCGTWSFDYCIPLLCTLFLSLGILLSVQQGRLIDGTVGLSFMAGFWWRWYRLLRTDDTVPIHALPLSASKGSLPVSLCRVEWDEDTTQLGLRNMSTGMWTPLMPDDLLLLTMPLHLLEEDTI